MPDKSVIYLNREELKRISRLQIPDKCISLNIARDILLFSCFSGLRYSDIDKLEWDNIGKRTIELTMVKTAGRVIIETNETTMAILAKVREMHKMNFLTLIE